jgi:hypothetical protein
MTDRLLKPKFLQSKWFWFIAGGFVLIGVIIFSVLIYKDSDNQDRLVSFAPVDSILYLTVFDGSWPKTGLMNDLPLDNFLLQIQNQNFSGLEIKKDLLAQAKRAAFVLVPKADQQLGWLMLFEFKKSKLDLPALVKIKNYSWLDQNKLAIATDPEILTTTKEVGAGKTFSLFSQINSSYLKSSPLNLFINVDNLKNYLAMSQISLNKDIIQLLKADWYLSLEKKNGQWQFVINGSFDHPEEINSALISLLPADFSFFLSQVSLKDFLSSYLGQGSLDWPAKLLFWEKIYNFDSKKAVSLLDQPASLITSQSSYIFFLNDYSSEQLASFKELIKVFLAQQSPTAIVHNLPDGTKVAELVADDNARQWQTESLGQDLNLEFIKEPKLNFELALLPLGHRLVISNSAAELKGYLKDQSVDLKSLIHQCPIRPEFKSQYFIFAHNALPFGLGSYLPAGRTLIKEDKKWVGGCILGL